MIKRTIRSASPLAWGRIFALSAALVTGGCTAGQSTEAAAVSEAPDSSTVLGSYLAGRFASDEQDYGSAADYFLLALSGDPQNPELLEDAIKALVGAGRVEEARAVAPRLIEVEPPPPRAPIVLALGGRKQGP